MVLLTLVFFPFVMVSEAIRGEESWWWIPLGIVLILVEVLVVVAAVDHWLGLGLIERINERLARANDEARPSPPETDEARLGPLYEAEAETDRVPGDPEEEARARAPSEIPGEATGRLRADTQARKDARRRAYNTGGVRGKEERLAREDLEARAGAPTNRSGAAFMRRWRGKAISLPLYVGCMSGRGFVGFARYLPRPLSRG